MRFSPSDPRNRSFHFAKSVEPPELDDVEAGADAIATLENKNTALMNPLNDPTKIVRDIDQSF